MVIAPHRTPREQDVWRAMAKGVAIGVCGREDYDAVMMTYHTSGPATHRSIFHEDRWLAFTGIQSSHGDRILNWKMIERDYNRRPIKPVIDLETTYPGISIMKGMKAGQRRPRPPFRLLVGVRRCLRAHLRT